MNPSESHHRTSDELAEEARHLFQAGAFDEAFEIGSELEERSDWRGAEVVALVYQELGQPEEAVPVMERAVLLEPTAWSAWQLLGNLRSQCEDFEGAFAAYRRARACPTPNLASLDFNEAVAIVRAGDHERGIALLLAIEGPLFLKARAQHLGLLNELGSHAEVLEQVETHLARHFGEADPEDLSAVWVEKSVALWRSASVEQAAECAWQALWYDRLNPRAMWLIRELTSEPSPRSRLFRLTIAGDWHEVPEGHERTPGFMTDYFVVAETPEEGLRFAASFERSEVRASLRIEAAEAIEQRPTDPKGVYEATVHRIFPAESEDESD